MTIGKKAFCILLAAVFVLCLMPANAFATGDGPRCVSVELNDTMTQLANTVTEPIFGTTAGEWTVFSLARGNYFAKDHAYFLDYYDRITVTVAEKAEKINLNGALDKNKSTENSRLIVALSAIGKDATSVGGWDLVEAYSANGINWIRKQGINGTIWALIALDSGNYETSDATIRQQCVDAILSARHNDGGWSLVTAKAQPSNVDITCMTLTALYPYRDQSAVAEACEEALTWLSESQLETGGFPYGQGETSESCAWAIVACTTWRINPDTDPRFIKNGKSAIDNLLSYYVAEEKMFAHQGTASNAMATDQSTYAMVAYDRLLKNQTALFDYSDVFFNPEENEPLQPVATLGLPQQITADPGTTFHASVVLNMWDSEADYKLIDFVIAVPPELDVTNVAAGNRLSGGEVSYHLEDGKLRVVYFDANAHSNIAVSGSAGESIQFFTITFCVNEITAGSKLPIGIEGMSFKRSSDSMDENAMTVVNTEKASGIVELVQGLSYSAVCLYTGDDIDLIPASAKAVALFVTGLANATKLTYQDGTNEYVFKHSAEISEKTGISTYIALVDASIPMENFVNAQYYTLSRNDAESVIFGDTNGDGVVNAQDALAVVDAWLRKGDAPTDDEILAMNVNGDSRINSFDALGIVESFVDGSDYGVVVKASTIHTAP